MKVSFIVPGEPQGKGRPQFSRRGNGVSVRTPEKTKDYEELIRNIYLYLFPNFAFPDDAILDLRVMAYYAIPKSISKRKRVLMLDRKIRPSKKPDADNILKVTADALNHIAYRDDAQIADMQVSKFFSEKPRLEIYITEVKP